MSKYQNFYDFSTDKSIHRFLKRGAELLNKMRPWCGSEQALKSEITQWQEAKSTFWGEYCRLKGKPDDMPQFSNADDFVAFVLIGSEGVVTED